VNDDPSPDASSASTPKPDAASQQPLVYTSAQLLQGRREAWIEHQGEMYRLRLTSQGKLYLTK
jgi:hemin uptake protein HemP